MADWIKRLFGGRNAATTAAENDLRCSLRPVSPVSPRMREVVVDTETTGLSPRAGHRIISVSLVEVFDAQNISVHLDLMVDPGRTIPAEATAIHGIRNADVRDGTHPRFGTVAGQILAFVGASRLVGYNLAFDLNFLTAEFAALGDLPPAMSQVGVDVMALFQQARLGPRRRLSAACEELGLDIAALKFHSACDDARATALLYIALRSRYAPQWNAFVQSAQVSVAGYEDVDRYYDDDDLQAAWELFEAKDYQAALARALTAVNRDEAHGGSKPNALGYELACMILRRQTRLKDEQDLLWRYFHRSLGPSTTADQIIALAVPPWEAGGAQLLSIADKEEAEALPNLGRRPQPQMWAMAERFARVIERLERKTETNEERLTRSLAALPSETAFTEAAVCLRKIIMERTRIGQDTRDELLRLHRLAQQHAFLYGTYRLGWDNAENKADASAGLYPQIVASVATAADMEAVLRPYQQVGYQHLPLLNKTDVRRLVAAFGEPEIQATPRECNMSIWERYRHEAQGKRHDTWQEQ